MINFLITHCTIACKPDIIKDKVIELFPDSRINSNHKKVTVFPNRLMKNVKAIAVYKKDLALQLEVNPANILFTKEKVKI